MSPALALALAIIVVGGFAILSRLALVGLAVSFWIVFAGVAAVVAATGHAITARWHLGPVEGLHLWTILAFSPEILVFLFFMLTDPRTVPAGSRQRVRFGVAVALVAALLVAASSTEFWAKVGVLGALTIVCAVRPLAAVVTSSIRPRRLVVAALADRGRRGLRGRARGGRVDHSSHTSDHREADDAAQEGPADRHSPVEGRRLDARPSERCSDRNGSPASSPGDDAASGHRVARGTPRSVPGRPRHPGVALVAATRRGGAEARRISDRSDPRAAIGVPAHHRVASGHGSRGLFESGHWTEQPQHVKIVTYLRATRVRARGGVPCALSSLHSSQSS